MVVGRKPNAEPQSHFHILISYISKVYSPSYYVSHLLLNLAQ